MTSVAAVILAAGQASRWRAAGGTETTKLVAEVSGKAIVRRVAEAALASRARPVVAVVGHARDEVLAALAGLEVAVAVNPSFASGIASSLRAGLGALPPGVAGAVVCLGDMPNVEAALVDRLIQAFEAAPGAAAVVPVSGGRRGNPVLLARPLFEAAMRLEGDEGARRLLAGLGPDRVVEIATAGDAAAFDVDTPGDLADTRPGGTI